MQNTLTIESATQFIQDFITGATNTGSLWYRTLDSDRSVYQWVSESYEVLINAKILDIPIHKISEVMTEQLCNNGLNHKVSNMREMIDRRFKNPRADTSEPNTPEIDTEIRGQSSSKEDFTEINKPLIDILDRWDESNQKAKEFLKTNSVELQADEKFMDMLLSITTAIEEKSNYLTDDRQKVFKSDQIILQRIKDVATRNYCYDALIIEKMKQQTISSKQMGKILDLDIKDPFFTLRPENEEQATQLNLTGANCDMCNKWRMRRKYNSDGHRYQDFCLDCGNWQKSRLSPLTN